MYASASMHGSEKKMPRSLNHQLSTLNQRALARLLSLLMK